MTIKLTQYALTVGPARGGVMRKWYVPLTVASIGGLGVFLFSESGRRALRWVGQYIRWNSEGLLEWNEAAEAELRRLQEALSAIGESLQPRAEMGQQANLGSGS
jgi:hypothetical protein